VSQSATPQSETLPKRLVLWFQIAAAVLAVGVSLCAILMVFKPVEERGLTAGIVDRVVEPSLRWALGPASLASVHRQLAYVLVRRGGDEAAVAHLAAALRLEPEQAELHATRGALLERLGREAEAAAAYREVLRLGERSPGVLNQLAWLLATTPEPGLRSPAEAVRLAEEAVALTQGADPSVLDTLAVAYAAAGRSDEALATSRRALELAEAQNLDDLARTIRQRLLEQRDRPGGP
jgi:tetratricopeptide (TPR) repeat protein